MYFRAHALFCLSTNSYYLRLVTFVPMITTKVIQPTPLLRPYVHHYWIIQANQESMFPIIMPTGCFKWIIHRKRPFWVQEETNFSAKASVSGPYEKAIHLSTEEELEMIMVIFYPYAFHLLTEIPGRLFTNNNVDFEGLDSRGFKTLKSQVLESESSDAAIARLESFLLRQLAQAKMSPYQQPLAKVFQSIGQQPILRIEALADMACLSERQFRRVFIEHVGLSPKQLLRIQRFHQVANRLISMPVSSFDSLINHFGFTDHSHFYREFQQFSGMSPTDFLHYLQAIQTPELFSAYRSYHDPRAVQEV